MLRIYVLPGRRCSWPARDHLLGAASGAPGRRIRRLLASAAATRSGRAISDVWCWRREAAIVLALRVTVLAVEFLVRVPAGACGSLTVTAGENMQQLGADLFFFFVAFLCVPRDPCFWNRYLLLGRYVCLVLSAHGLMPPHATIRFDLLNAPDLRNFGLKKPKSLGWKDYMVSRKINTSQQQYNSCKIEK